MSFNKGTDNPAVNRNNFFKKLGINPQDVVLAKYAHGSKVFKALSEKKGKYVNLSLAIKKQLVKEGVGDKNIEISTSCTLCDKKFFSHRRPGNNSAMGAVIGNRKKVETLFV
jgi:copper oxidase (laccase) domain-containing protein